MKKVYCLYRVSDPRQVQDYDIPMQRTVAYGGGTACQLAKALNERKRYPKSGKPWRPASLYGMLRNPLYTGVLRRGGARGYQPGLQIISQSLFAHSLKPSPGIPKKAHFLPACSTAALAVPVWYPTTSPAAISERTARSMSDASSGTTAPGEKTVFPAPAPDSISMWQRRRSGCSF